jgi:hypothetical protein
MITDPVILKLREHIDLQPCKNNHKMFISKVCPFCNYTSTRPFRYNSKLRVGKSYCCGCSFKDLHWLELQIGNPRFAYDYELEHKRGWFKNMSNEDWIIYKNFIKEKSTNIGSFEKSRTEDLDLPF